ncbi:hypothetical protein VTJ49DRAFT_5001 [Mycothermus thermophilus]|uniref:1-phosphatidylinositol-3-phosphate 5-kinase n=1 Tax=Humicola insolens TaxID=85995 RepID=A0ABR3VL72_HUMIN
MASFSSNKQPSLGPSAPSSPVTVSVPVDRRTRRGSIASRSSVQLDRDKLASTLDKIHTSASQSDALTTFNDLAPPPDNQQPSTEPRSTATDLVQQGFSGLYSRFKEAVTGVTKAPQALDIDDAGSNRDDASSKKSAATVAAVPAPVSKPSSLPRGESTGTTSTLGSATSSDAQTSAFSTTSAPPPESQTTAPQSSKASSVAATPAQKTPLLSAQHPPRIAKTPAITAAADATVAPVTVQGLMDIEPTRARPPRVEDARNRNPALKSISRAAETTQSPNLTGSASLESISSAGARDRTAGSIDSSADVPRSPVQASTDARPSPSSSRLHSTSDVLRRPAVIDRILPARAKSHSRSSSMEPNVAAASPISTSAHSSVHHESFAHNEQPQMLQSGAMKIPGTTTNEGAPEVVNARLECMRKQVLSKEFWMADETCKECFLCGTPFTAFRRKHHCRTCGCIFDSKCTSNISGQKFGVPGTLRVCKTCLNVINRRYESGSDDSGDESYLPAIFRAGQQSKAAAAAASSAVTSALSSSKLRTDDEASVSERTDQADDSKTPMMAIPATRRTGDGHRHSTVLEIDVPPQLSRPGSSRSLRSLSTSRPQSSGHRRHHSKHNFLSRFKALPEDRAPFRNPANHDAGKKSNANAFHADNIIDPELADYVSDESSEDEQMGSIFATLDGASEFQPASLDPSRASFSTYLSTGKKHRFRQGDKSVSGFSHASRGHDDGGVGGGLQGLPIHTRQRRRNLSTASASVHYHLRSPRPKSAGLKGPSASADTLSVFESAIDAPGPRRAESMREPRSAEDGLNPASMQHVKKLFRQLLDDAQIPNPAGWEKALLPILDRCSDDVDPDIQNGDDMDIRHWVKLKKIPGGKPSDTAYVHGVVFTKNLALKSMPRKIRNPRIILITFPLEYQRHPEQHFMSLQPVIEQEKEYLRIVVNRILNLEPHVLLAEKSVAGLALQYLAEANVAVAYNVKPSVIEAVARIVNMPVISSMDMLSLGARVGVSESFEVRTFVNNEMRGRKKTYIFISGCPKDRGCTIALRGASSDVLARMKRITEFMVYVVYNLKLESCLMRDEFVQIPSEAPAPALPTAASTLSDGSLPSAPDEQTGRPGIVITRQSTEGADTSQPSEAPAGRADAESTTAAQAPAPSTPPALSSAESAHESVSMHELHAHNDVPDDIPMASYHADKVVKYETRILSASPFVKFRRPYLLTKAREQERRAAYLKKLLEQEETAMPDEEKQNPEPFQLVKPEMVRGIERTRSRKIMEVIHAVHDAEYDKALHSYRTQARQWEAYTHGSLDLFDPFSHQNIVVLYAVNCMPHKMPCVGPDLIGFEFYNEHPEPDGLMVQDCTLGQYISDICDGAEYECHGEACPHKMYEHNRTYVHDNARLTVVLDMALPWPENFPEKPQVMDGDRDGTGICMWNYCKQCKKHFGLMPMSVSTWKYSFGKYLELSFWNTGLRLNPATECPHDHQKDHVRYFHDMYRDIAVSVHYDPIDLYEIIVPRNKITWKVDYDLKLKNDIFLKVSERWDRFMASVRARLKSIRTDSVLPEKADACKAELERLNKKAQEDQPELTRSLEAAYMNSKYYEVTPLNAVIRQMLEKVTDWDAAFNAFEAEFLSDKDVRQLTILQLKKLFTDHESKESLPSTEGGTTPSVDSLELDEKVTPAASPPGAPSETEEKPSQPTEEDKSSQPSEEGEGSQPQAPPVLSPTAEALRSPNAGPAPEAANLLERVEPLDLAAPVTETKPALGAPDAVQESGKPPSDHVSESATSPVPCTPSLIPQPSVLPPLPTPPGELSLTEKIERLRREQQAKGAGSSKESATTSSLPRRAGAAMSPPLVRAISQPAGTLTRSQTSISKLLKETKGVETGTDSPRLGPEGTLKSDKRLSERIGLGTLKGHRKAAPSGIPRYVHKKETKVSSLARHFEQLSREFEKERMKDRKQRAAKAHHTRAFLPRSSTKTIVEVYKDVDQAVREPVPLEDEQPLLPDQEQQLGKTAGGSSRVGTQSVTAESQRSTKPSPDEPSSSQELPSQASEPDGADRKAAEGEEHQREGSRAETDDEGAESDVDNAAITLDDILPGVKAIAESLEPSEEPGELPKHEKKSLMTMLTKFWAERSASSWPQLEYPINATDHIFFDSDVIIKEDEPSSLVAFALSSEDYQNKLAEIRQKWAMPTSQSAADDAEDSSDGLEMKSSDPEKTKPPKAAAASIHSVSGDRYNDAELEKSLLRETGMHVKYQFSEGSARMTCQIFYAEQFDALRCKCGVAERFVESLSRCLKWDSKGGKTKSVFLKTLDERFILKSLSPIETSSFLRFAPDYFSIMSETLFHDLPSVIAKMFGFFRVYIKNPVTGTECKLDLLVMENLFYDRSPSRTFDLKGAFRNRKIQSTGEQNEVLLDENMVEYIYESPLFARDHAKRLLRASVFNDTLFLAKQDVMDYSLMVAVDEVRREIVVGIIDCIRTYTWDKQLESWIKARGLAGGGKNRPTVTSPREYKSRFREAMARYILQAPNCWHTFGSRVGGAPMNTPATPRPRFEEDA